MERDVQFRKHQYQELKKQSKQTFIDPLERTEPSNARHLIEFETSNNFRLTKKA